MIKEILSDITLLNNVLLLSFFIVFLILFYREHRADDSPVLWTDMLVDAKTQKLSIAKVGNFIGVIVSTWIMIYLVQVKEAYAMYPALFTVWLAFLAGVYTLNNYINAKHKKDDRHHHNDEPE